MHKLLYYMVLTAGAVIPAAFAGRLPLVGMLPLAKMLPDEGKMPALNGATAWLNTQALTPERLRGKVVLVEFWTYTCINWRRTLPYVRAWAHKYKDQGLVVIAVSTPEFSFEHKEENVRWAVGEMGLDFPVAIDNNYAIWKAFNNQYWPALYFVDAKGRIRHHQFGEGDYENSERVIQQLLKEAGAAGVDQRLVELNPQGAETAADWHDVQCQETYVGYDHAINFASPGGAVFDRPFVYTRPAVLNVGQWALTGDWTVGKEAAVLNKPGGKIVFHFHARDLNLVMGPPGAARAAAHSAGAADAGHPAARSMRFRVLIDGEAPGAAHGADIDARGEGILDRQRMYQLIRQPGLVQTHDFTIEFSDAGAEAFDFTFG